MDSIKPYLIEKKTISTGETVRKSVPVWVETSPPKFFNGRTMTEYCIKHEHFTAGYVHLIDIPKGVFVSFIENYMPERFCGFGKIADQIEVEHCLNRGLDRFEIVSDAALNSHAYHYTRGKRFGSAKERGKSFQNMLLARFQTTDLNKIVERIIRETPKGETFSTSFLGSIPMFMPQKLIKKYLEIIKRYPLLK